jgi:hypothetical protein
VAQQACAILQTLIMDTAQVSFISKKATTVISPVDKLMAPLKALGSTLTNGECPVSHNTLLEV